MTPSRIETQFELGTNGYLGVRDAFVTFRGKFYGNALGAHAPSIIEYDLDGTYHTFEAEAVINDIAEDNRCNPVNFLVYADDRLVAYVPRVRAHEPPRSVIANINGAKKLRLEIEVAYNGYNNWCQSVWLSPQIHTEKYDNIYNVFRDTQIKAINNVLNVKSCIFTIVAPGRINEVDRMLNSLHLYNDCSELAIVLFVSEELSAYTDLSERYNITLVPYGMTNDDVPITESAITALAINEIVNAESYLFISPDVVVCDTITNLLAAYDTIDDEKVLACSNRTLDIVGYSLADTVSWKDCIYKGAGNDWEFLRLDGIQQYYQFIIDNHVMLFSTKSLLAIKHFLEEMMPNIMMWRNRIPELVAAREQALLNCAIAKISMGVEIDHTYNWQTTLANIENISVDLYDDKPRLVDNISGKKVKMFQIHDYFNLKYPLVQEFYSPKNGSN